MIAEPSITHRKIWRLFSDQFKSDMMLSPETATSYGYHRLDHLLDARSTDHAERRNTIDQHFLSRLRAFSPARLTQQDRVSRELLIRLLQQRIADYELKEYEMPVSQMNGVHLEIADLPRSMPLTTLRQYDAYIARLHQVTRAFAETLEVLRQGERDHLMPYRPLLEKIPAQCEAIVRDDPFIAPTLHYPSTISAASQIKLTAAIKKVVDEQVLPAYRAFARFIATDYAPNGRSEPGLRSLPNGADRYRNAIREQTTTELTPPEIHALGIKEVARITELLNALALRRGYKDFASYRLALASDPRYTPSSSSQIVDDFARYIAGVQPVLPRYFSFTPKTPVTLEVVPPSQPGNATHYIPGTSDGGRPGRIVVATSNFRRRSLINDETIAYHEGDPGHHLQTTIQQELKGIPQFRQHVIYGAYAEGWAVYSEMLMKEAGLFQNPDSDYGRLQTELLRAVRLVVDTGIHSDGWSRDQAIAYFRATGAADEQMVQSETDRYIAWPAQSLTYKIGQLKILELRERARSQLGSTFDLRAFHDLLLEGGSLPLDVLQANVEAWVAARLPSSGASSALPNASG